METTLRAVLVEWLRADAILANLINTVSEEAPSRTAPPWLAIAASASADWSTKDRAGREVRVALELHCRGDDATVAAATVRAIEARLEAFPRLHPEFEIAGGGFRRARSEQRPGNTRAVLLEYVFRLLAA